MRLDPLGDLNWLAVIVGAVIYFAIGAVWFTPIPLGRQWQRARNRLGRDAPPTGDEPDHLRRSGALAYAVAAIATGMLAVATGSDTVAEGIVLGPVVGIG
jgi:hypothetical protein